MCQCPNARRSFSDDEHHTFYLCRQQLCRSSASEPRILKISSPYILKISLQSAEKNPVEKVDVKTSKKMNPVEKVKDIFHTGEHIVHAGTEAFEKKFGFKFTRKHLAYIIGGSLVRRAWNIWVMMKARF